jgi:hypothetical protein
MKLTKNKTMATIQKGVPKTKEFLAKSAKAKQVSVGKDKAGYFVYTHRWRSKSYKTINGITKKDIEFCESTG